MIKECKVTLHNDAVTVVKFDNVSVQFPSVLNDGKLYVELKDGKYRVVTNEEFKKLNTRVVEKEMKRQKYSKNTDDENIVIDKEGNNE